MKKKKEKETPEEAKTEAAAESPEGEEAEKKPKLKIKLKYVLLVVIVIIPLLAVSSIFIANKFFSPKPAVYANAQQGVSVKVTLNYNEATTFLNYTEKTCVSGEQMGTLPTPKRKGYIFTGWYCGNTLYTPETIVRTDKDFTITATWVKLFDEKLLGDIAAYSDKNYEGEAKSVKVGEYAETDIKFGSVYIKNGYRLTLYPKPNFEGDPVVYISNTPEIIASALSFKVDEIPSDSFQLGTLTPERKVEILKMYAPRIWFCEEEDFMPATVDESLKNQNRVLSSNGYIFTQELKKDSEIPEYFHGNLKLAKAYAFFVEKNNGCIDLVYFQYFPYTIGDTVLNRHSLNRIGDWQYLAIRLKTYKENETTLARPTIVALPAHGVTTYVSWDTLKIDKKTQRPAFYSAAGTHALYLDEGTYKYGKKFIFSLKDVCNQGYSWDLWKDGKLETFSYDALKREGEGIGETVWNRSFDIDVFSPEGYAVWSWGNERRRKRVEFFPPLDDSLVGPQFKKVLCDYYAFD